MNDLIDLRMKIITKSPAMQTIKSLEAKWCGSAYFFLDLSFLSWTFMIPRTVGERGGYFYSSLPSLPSVGQVLGTLSR